MEEPGKLLGRITADPEVLVGQPCIRGLRISVEHVLEALAAGLSVQMLLDEYVVLEPEDIRATLLYAKELVEMDRVYPLGQSGDPR